MKKLYKYHEDCGREGILAGLFVAEEETVQEAIGKKYYVDDILGKHSEVYGQLKGDSVEEVTKDQTFLYDLLEVFGIEVDEEGTPLVEKYDEYGVTLVGHNPLYWVEYANTVQRR